MKELWLFTMHYPYGLRESFLENELPVLCQRFDRVLVFPEQHDADIRSMPPNAELHEPIVDPCVPATMSELLRNWPLVLKLIRSLVRDAPSWKVFRAHWPALRSRIAQLIKRSMVLQERIMPTYDPDRVVVYTYWTHDWTTVLGLVKERSAALRFFSRAHGFDVFEAQNIDGWIPFRSFQLDHVSRIYCASKAGLEHLRARHPKFRDRFELAQLGTQDHGPGPYSSTGPLRVVSCSFLVPRKRVLRLVEALALVRQPVQWTHFGGGEEEEEVRKAAAGLPAHIKVDIRGMTVNARIMEWYRNNPVDVFVHLSHLEGGVVVAVQEAASFGIPIIAADSGGIREIMGPRTGILLGNEPSAAEVAALLEEWRTGPMATAAFHEGVRAAWKEQFEATKVYNRFVDTILQ